MLFMNYHTLHTRLTGQFGYEWKIIWADGDQSFVCVKEGKTYKKVAKIRVGEKGGHLDYDYNTQWNCTDGWRDMDGNT